MIQFEKSKLNEYLLNKKNIKMIIKKNSDTSLITYYPGYILGVFLGCSKDIP